MITRDIINYENIFIFNVDNKSDDEPQKDKRD